MFRCSWGFLLFITSPLLAAEGVDYTRDIKPLLEKHCVSCHGSAKQKASLRLDAYPLIKQGGNSGSAFVSKKSTESLLIHAITGSKPDVSKMPPKGELSADEISLLKRWIDEGAVGPAQVETVASANTKSTHWSFQPITRPALPTVKNQQAVRNPIDQFVLEQLEAKAITPATEADKVTLIRRLSLDLRGLPPSIAEVDAFLADQSPQAYEKVVDSMLKSPHYGEHWARLWLDMARYADSNGFTIDAPRSIWKYRDWVINAFNKNMPFDRFTIEQLAGDMLPKPTNEQLTATGFHRNTMINQEGGIDVEQFRVESVVDRVNTTGAVWLGITIGCCQCHDHKFDPFSQKEYYQFYAFMNNCDEPNLEIITPEDQARRQRIKDGVNRLTKLLKPLDPTSAEAIEKWERGLNDQNRGQVAKNIAAIFLVAPNGRNAKQIQTLETAFRRNDLTRHIVGINNPWQALLQMNVLTTRNALQTELADLKKLEPIPPTTMIVRERKQPRETTIMIAGDFTRKGAKVTPGFPSVFPAKDAARTRLDLAQWIVDPANPLTARVAVNRWWGQFFGIGLVETENDFGTQGTMPSHPKLLDWLASEFIAKKWDVKALHKLIVMSGTYCQSSKTRPELDKVDPRNRLLARQSRIRVNAENVRDVCLSASGLLTPTVGGPSVFPPQPEGIYRFTQVDKGWKASPGEERYRRGMYTYFWRSAPHPQLVTFDAPDASTSCTRRNRSNTPLQALTLLNDSGFYEYAQGFANRIQKECAGDDTAKLLFAFRAALSRQPSERELSRLQSFLARQQADLKDKPNEAKQLSPNAPELAAWVMVARVLLNLDELITRE
jgi:hypothetical protein